jgi:hypothetical protein
MAELSPKHKIYVVMRRAAFATPAEIVRELRDLYEVTASPQQLAIYDPSHAAGMRLSEDLKLLFQEARAKFLADTSDVLLATPAGRTRFLDRLAQDAAAKGNLMMALKAAEQIAKDLGGQYLARIEIKTLDDDTLRHVLGLSPGGAQSGGDEARADPKPVSSQ